MLRKQSSSRASTIAGKVLRTGQATADEVKILAASVLSQDETKGQTKTVLDTFWLVIDDIKKHSGMMEPINNMMHPLNSAMHPLKSAMHPLASIAHPLNSIANANRGQQRLQMLKKLLNEYT